VRSVEKGSDPKQSGLQNLYFDCSSFISKHEKKSSVKKSKLGTRREGCEKARGITVNLGIFALMWRFITIVLPHPTEKPQLQN